MSKGALLMVSPFWPNDLYLSILTTLMLFALLSMHNVQALAPLDIGHSLLDIGHFFEF
jgi:hypothetical protein